MFYGCSNLTSVPQLDISNVTDMTQMFSRCSSLQEIRFVGKPKNSIKLTRIMSLASTVGTLYYPAEYADAYQKIINAFPSNWVKVAE
jgi:surface protein